MPQGFITGGLGRNRTTDTRIFNALGSARPSINAGCSSKVCSVRQTVLQKPKEVLRSIPLISSADFGVIDLQHIDEPLLAKAFAQCATCCIHSSIKFAAFDSFFNSG